jgi:hypothetical protein
MSKKRFMNYKGRRKDIVAAGEWVDIPEDERRGVGFVDVDSSALAASSDIAKALAKAQMDIAKMYGGN